MGFFQVVNHGVPAEVMAGMLMAVRGFHEEEAEVKKVYYTRERNKKVRYQSNFDLFQSPAADWRDTIFMNMLPEPPLPEEIPAACRDICWQYVKHIQKLGALVFRLISEFLGLNCNHFEDIEAIDVAMHYYPPCPEPHLTFGTRKHADPSFLTVLLQDNIGGLQILHQDHWVDVSCIPGALVINVGDLLQLVTNSRIKSLEHRVIAKSIGPRVSVACFFRIPPSRQNEVIGPIAELTSAANPALYRRISVTEYIMYFYSKGLDGIPTLDYFKL